jgi:hypothetical protein
LVMATFSIIIIVIVVVTTAHAFVLTVSHGLLFRQPRYLRRHRCRRFSSPNDVTSTVFFTSPDFHFARWRSNPTASAASRSKSFPCERYESSANQPSPAV